MATYTKLRTGWGVRVTGDAPQPGQCVTVTKKNGGTKNETIERVLFSKDSVHLCAIKQREAKPVSICYSCGCEFRGEGDYCGC